MVLKGEAYTFSDNINTDGIISGRYKFAITDMKELSKHIMEDIDPNFTKNLKPGVTMIVAGENFGLGSSREQAPLVIKEAGVVCVIAESFARIFYRNSFNIGLMLIEADTTQISNLDTIEIDVQAGVLKDLTKNIILRTKSLPQIMRTLLADGGLVNHFKKHNGIQL